MLGSSPVKKYMDSLYFLTSVHDFIKSTSDINILKAHQEIMEDTQPYHKHYSQIFLVFYFIEKKYPPI